MQVNIKCKSTAERDILSDIHIEFPSSGLVFIVGRSGAGKTSLLNILGGIDSNFDGTVIYNEKAKEETAESRKRNIGIVYQDFNLIGTLNVRDNILLGAQISGSTRMKKRCAFGECVGRSHKAATLNGCEISDKYYRQILEMLNIEHIENREITMLSGGEKQRVAIARAMLRDNHIILADEPTGNLDEENAKNIYEILKKLSKERLLIVVTHDLAAAREYGDRIIELRDGRIVSDEDMGYSKNPKLCLPDDGAKKNTSWRLPYIRKGMISRKAKIVNLFTVLVVAMVCAFLALGLYSGVTNIMSRMDTSLLENDRFDVKQDELETGYSAMPITEDMIDDIQEMDVANYIVGFYQTSVEVSYQENSYKLNYQYIDNTDFFRDRYSDVIEGKIPETEDEVMIDSALSEVLFGSEECIGETITLTYDGLTKELTVCGVKDSYQSDDGGGQIYIMPQLIEKIYEESITTVVAISDSEQATREEIDMVSLGEISETAELVQGRYPEEADEIAVDVTLVNRIIACLDSTSELFAEEDIESGKANEYLLDRELNFIDISSYTNIGTMKIVGLVKCGDTGLVYYSDAYTESGYVNNVVSVYVKSLDDDVLKPLYDYVEKNNLYYEQNAKAVSLVIRSQMSLAMFALGIMSVIIFVISGIMAHLFTKISLMERQYEMGVLSAMGNEKSQIMSLLFEELVIIAIITCVSVDVLCGVLGAVLGSGLVKFNGIVVFGSEWWHFVLIDALIFFAVIVFSVGDIMKIAKKDTSLSLAQKYQ